MTLPGNLSNFDREQNAYRALQEAKRALAKAESNLIEAEREYRNAKQGGAYEAAIRAASQKAP